MSFWPDWVWKPILGGKRGRFVPASKACDNVLEQSFPSQLGLDHVWYSLPQKEMEKSPSMCTAGVRVLGLVGPKRWAQGH